MAVHSTALGFRLVFVMYMLGSLFWKVIGMFAATGVLIFLLFSAIVQIYVQVWVPMSSLSLSFLLS
jgi:hypothetical protein